MAFPTPDLSRYDKIFTPSPTDTTGMVRRAMEKFDLAAERAREVRAVERLERSLAAAAEQRRRAFWTQR